MKAKPALPGTTEQDSKHAQEGAKDQTAGNDRAIPQTGIDSPVIASVEAPHRVLTDAPTTTDAVPHHTDTTKTASTSSPHTPYTPTASPQPSSRKAPYSQTQLMITQHPSPCSKSP